MLHMVKLAVGVHSLEELAARQSLQIPPVDDLDGTSPSGQPWFRTRMYPRRAAEILDGGSIYRVISGRILCRQRITAITPDTREDGVACALVVMAPEIIPVSPRAMRPFQGWRYLKPADAPPDLLANSHSGDALPEALRNELAELCLI
ncbi:hypothetical protein B0W47_11970 [Komagataeibacter nataicola]|uniref:Lysophospholipase n=1 Tax=Komagataeibacter nataicola TaxID=265960 RepID=A0A9N7H1D9_9PROT|nr:DUF1489 domain-containing protein [Komagataeibacter nataicola]AQU88062.1 hypothetical protein B0W47_11970 [Komagataeibacter nataicola]PYD66950.1 hypothetical protein CDI09_06035 [Komagataeibacter nataicola]WEQ54843.1 DUF1489 domain-containing protein [Komagataeibacter nataicola]WNM09177.1 DUF1489 domain-containing protein [Komagataeibacter nataicola]GBR17566.1 hypothetical protein AA0616_1080 [Komagataeibacter nataicola NRIC 0616]